MMADHDILHHRRLQNGLLASRFMKALGLNGRVPGGHLLKPSMTLPAPTAPIAPAPIQVRFRPAHPSSAALPPPCGDPVSRADGEGGASVYTLRHQCGRCGAPWHLGFSYGRALQHSIASASEGHDLAAGQRARLPAPGPTRALPAALCAGLRNPQ